MNILASTLLSFLPRRYRELFTSYGIPPEGALVGGILEALSCLCLMILRYQAFTAQRLTAIPLSVMGKAGETAGESAIMGLGTILLLEYALQLTTLALLFLTVEGAVRAVAAVVSGETLPSLPLYALAFLQTRFEKHGRELRLGKRIRDEAHLTANGESLQIASCRPKPWTQMTTIAYEGEYYKLVKTDGGPAPRPFVYILRKKPASEVIRGFCSSDPDELLRPKN